MKSGDEAPLGLEDEEVSGLAEPAAEPISPCFHEDFTCLGRLGRGAFGEVWHCRDNKDGKEYAVKAVRYRKSGSTTNAERVAEHEVQMLKEYAHHKANHPNILSYYRSWIEVDTNSCGGNGNSCSSALPWASPTIQPSVSPSFSSHTFKPLDAGVDDADLSYDGGTFGSAGVVFEGTQGEEPTNLEEAPFVAVLQDDSEDSQAKEKVEGIEGHRCISSGWSSDAAASDSSRDVASSQPTETATLFIQVELCREETLQGWIARNNVADRPDEEIAEGAVSILAQCAHALSYLHENSCMHRDVKPSNILFAQDGNVRLADFGLAKALDEQESEEMLRQVSPSWRNHIGSRQCSGTPSYASPEQRAGEPLDVSTDVYSLGLVLLELICPVKTQMERAAILEQLRNGREVPSAIGINCQKLADLAMQMTDPDPSKRPTAREVFLFSKEASDANRQPGASAILAAVASSVASNTPALRLPVTARAGFSGTSSWSTGGCPRRRTAQPHLRASHQVVHDRQS
jgi:serine/threonine protein kinase